MSDEAIIQFFEKRKFEKTCGRFEKSQLDRINTSLLKTNYPSPINLMKAILLSATVSLVACNPAKRINSDTSSHHSNEEASSFEIIGAVVNPDSLNSVIVKGVVVDENEQPHIGANIVYGKTGLGTSTDLEGAFELIIPIDKISGKDITVQYIGCENLDIKLDEVKNREVNVLLIGPNLDDVIIIGMIEVH